MDNSEITWNNSIAYAGNLLSAISGMRQGEILALEYADLHNDYIHVKSSWDRNYGLKDTKTHEERFIPIPEYIFTILSQLNNTGHEGFVFSIDGGKAPVSGYMLTKELYHALDKIKINAADRKKRNITFHSWRYFFNTLLRSKGIPDSKTQKLTGHKTIEMTDRYTKFSINDFSDVAAIQEVLL